MTEVNWSDIERDMQARIQQTVKDTQSKAKSCAVRAANALRNAELNVLRGQRSGRVYKKPGVSTHYTASAPGEPPAVRTGMLRMSWGIKAEGDGKGNYTAAIYTDTKYAEMLETGTSRMSARPYKEKIVEKARPQVVQIFSQLKT
ncbi:MAG: HK97 gp10 family phage protein [Clostridia bacterium]|nr:HK97 gp10 family phage protein [Clostridia bacterium]